MGLEAVCVAHYGESVSEGKALLESNDLRFRGDFRLTIPFTEVDSVAAGDGKLKVIEDAPGRYVKARAV